MKKSFYIIFTSLLAVSCSGNDDHIIENPKPVEKEVYSFGYKNYNVRNISSYKGPLGQKKEVSESYLNSYWSTYSEPAWKKISLDLKNNSLHLISGTSADITYSVKIKNDSVFINENSGQNFIGIFNKNEALFTLKRSLISIKKMPRESVNGLTFSQKVIFGITGYQDVFGNSIFSSPSEMTAAGDDVLWCNIDYYFPSL